MAIHETFGPSNLGVAAHVLSRATPMALRTMYIRPVVIFESGGCVT